MKNIFFFLLLLSAVLITAAFSATLQDDFLKNDTYVRQLGMGGAATAVADDLGSVFYNPAGLSNAGPTGMSFGNIDTNKEIIEKDHYYSYNLGSLGYLGFERETPTGEKAKVDMFGMGRKSGMGISYGLTFKNIYWDNITKEARGYSADVGILINVTPQFTIGILGQDAISAKDLELTGITRVGGAYRPFEDWLLIAADTEIGRQGPGDFTHYGIEAKVTQGFKLRTGMDRGYTTFGATFDLPFMAVHYAGLLNKDAPSGTVQMIAGEISLFERPQRPLSIVRPKEFALINVGGNIVGGMGEFSIFGGGRIGADAIVAQIKDATKDPYVDGIILKIRGFEGGLGSFGIVQEIRTELLKSKEDGKKIVAYMEEGCLGDEYYLASVADKVIAPPSSTVGGIGKSISVIRIRGLLEKLGIESQMLAQGKYKTTFSMTSPELTREQRTMLRGVLADLYRQMVTDIGQSRKASISMNDLKAISDGRIFSASKAKELGLIDEVGYFKDATHAAAELYKSKDEVRVVENKDIIQQEDEEYLFVFPNKIVVIDIDGDIITGRSGQNILFGGHATGADTVSEQIRKAVDDWQVKAIIVRVNSGGGSAVASGQIYSELKRARQKNKIVVASMGDFAASGGYYISAAADKIVADPGTITGSIGVVEGDLFVYSGLLKMLGIKAETIKEGSHSDMLSGLRRLSTEETRSLLKYMDETYQEFVGAVASGRGMTTTEVLKLAEGRIYTGSQALDVKLVDKLGNFTDSVDLAAELAKIPGEPKLVYYREGGFMFGLGSGVVNMLGIGDGILPRRSGALAEYKLNY